MRKYSKYLMCFIIFISIIPNIPGIEIKCFDCESTLDPKCADLFDNSTIALTYCGKSHQTPNVCRKTRERVNGEWKYTRGCGFFSQEVNMNRCFEETVSDNILVEHCMCNDRDGCNSSFIFGPTSMLLMLPVFVKFLIL